MSKNTRFWDQVGVMANQGQRPPQQDDFCLCGSKNELHEDKCPVIDHGTLENSSQSQHSK